MTILDVNKVSEIRNNLNEDNYQKMITLNLGYENLNLDYLGYDEKVVKLVTSDFIRINKIMPIYEKENKFMVVTGDAFNIKAIDTLKALLDKDIEIIVSSNEKIQKINNCNAHRGLCCMRRIWCVCFGGKRSGSKHFWQL